MSDISHLARRWMRQAELGRGIRLSADEHDLLNAIGLGEIIAAEAAKLQRTKCLHRSTRLTRGENTPSAMSAGETEPSGTLSSTFSGMTNGPSVERVAARARLMSRPQSRR
jgi:hypothetical protein